MPQIIQIELSGRAPATPFDHATGSRALVLKWLKCVDDELATTIHDANQPKPYTISPLWNREGRVDTLTFEIAVLTDWLTAALLEGVRQSPKTVRLGQQEYARTAVEVKSKREWEDFFSPSYTHEFAFQLLTPTAHHAPGDARKSIVLPSPELYFGSWLNRWNLCCDTRIDPELMRIVENQVAVTACSGETKKVRIDQNRPFIGFVGEVRFRLLKPETVNEESRRGLTALARFASFCGTGVDTIRGMGQTRLS